MIKIIVNAFVEEGKETTVVEVLFASSDHEKVKTKYQELMTQYPEIYLRLAAGYRSQHPTALSVSSYKQGGF
ncbi:hypothetical protein C6A32_00150 [Streptococcus anginosus]|nr:hypothetical protein SMU88_00700 [Streptococcus mutans NLML8]EMC17138.1 hypothetical protein SMU77_05885 [Streptococcus mutans NV1996]EMC23121.1 hypothetical protein SMU81_05079 [Streptococcus mutans SF14]PRT72561.1 hypothetical protein C6A32_00150 [Streptococcus anginosus]QFG44622.1 hypothetical protein FSA28_1892 [Streptococcus mutans]